MYGVTGSGKTTLAHAIGNAAGLPFHSMDDLFWSPGWVRRSKEEQRAAFTEICTQERWVVDAAESGSLDVVHDRVQLIVALDFPRLVSLVRLVRRTLQRIGTREVVCNGNVETWRSQLSADSILVWHFRSFALKRAWIRDRAEAPDGPPVLVLTRPKQAATWLDQVRRVGRPSTHASADADGFRTPTPRMRGVASVRCQ